MGCGVSAPRNYATYPQQQPQYGQIGRQQHRQQPQQQRAEISRAPTTHFKPYPTEQAHKAAEAAATARGANAKDGTELAYVAEAGNPVVLLASLKSPSEAHEKSQGGTISTTTTFKNNTHATFDIYWRDHSGNSIQYGSVAPGKLVQMTTYAGHVWLLVAGKPGPKPAMKSQLPPYQGTVWFSKELITEKDPTAFTGLVDKGQAQRNVFDRRANSNAGGWLDVNAWLFAANFGGSKQRPTKVIEVQANPADFTQAAARKEVQALLVALGKLPAFLLAEVDSIWLHGGDSLFGGGNRNILMYTGSASQYARDGVLEEALIHEATHTSMDADHAKAPGWLAAQSKDPVSISNYGRDHPDREDLAESMGPYLGFRFRSDRLTDKQKKSVADNIPNRVKYLDSLNLSMDIIK